MSDDDDSQDDYSTNIDPSEVTIADILNSAAKRQVGTVTASAREEDGSVQWAAIVIRGEGADEMFEAVTQAMDKISAKWQAESIAAKNNKPYDN